MSRGKMAALHFPLLLFDPSLGSYISNTLFSGSQIWSLCQRPRFAWELVENAESGAPSQTYRMRNSWEVRLGSNLCFNKTLGDSDVCKVCYITSVVSMLDLYMETYKSFQTPLEYPACLSLLWESGLEYILWWAGDLYPSWLGLCGNYSQLMPWVTTTDCWGNRWDRNALDTSWRSQLDLASQEPLIRKKPDFEIGQEQLFSSW